MNCANHPDRERVAFCQNCGKPLCQECMRSVGSAVFCEPCLIAKLAGAGTANPAGGPATSPGTNYPGANYPIDGSIPPQPTVDEPNPVLAAILGFIPGVGAMYNGQYAKGFVHLIVFIVLVSLADENGIFGLFIAGWVFYQVIEAHHTAQARRDGAPLPNPFGLNDLGERLGFGKTWSAGAQGRTNGQGPAADGSVPPAAAYQAPPTGYQPYTAPPPTSPWGAPWESYVPPVPPAASFTGAPVPPIPPTDFNSPPYPHNHFPTGAIWLIGLGLIFLTGSMFHGYAHHWFVPMLLIGFGVWQIVNKMTETGPLGDDGTATYRFRLFHALRSGVWIILVGILFLLDSSHILPWSRSWPLFIIVAGVLTILQRAAFSSAAAAPYPYTVPPPTGPTQTTSTSIVPSTTHDDEEGK